MDTRLNRILTNNLLPPIGFGKRPSMLKLDKENSGNESKLVQKRNLKTNLNLIDDSIARDNVDRSITKDFDIEFYINDKNVEYEFEILSEDNNITGNKWEEDFYNKKFPVELLKIELLTKDENDNVQYYFNKKINRYINKFEDEDIILEKRFTNISKIWIGWTIKLKDNSKIRKIRGRICYKYNDRNYKGILSKVKEETNNE